MVTSGLRTILVAIAALVFGSAGAYAQDALCGGLSEADCAILIQSQEAMSALESAKITFNLEMTFGGIPDMPSSATINLSGDGRYAITDPEALQNITANMTDDLAGAMEDLFKAFALDGTFILQLPAELISGTGPNRGAFSVRMVDGFAYINFDKMMELMGGAGGASGWMGFDLAGFYGRLFEQMGGDLGLGAIQNQSAAADMMAEFVTIERVEDVEFDGQTLAAFQYMFDYSELASNETFMSLLRDQLEGMGMMGQIDMDALMDFYAEAFTGLTLEMTQLVGLDDHYIHNLTLQLAWALDMGSLGELFGGGMSDIMPSITIDMSANADLSQFNEAAPIEAPEDATIFPLDSMLPAMPQTFESQEAAA
jgi:hypothetical protein